MNNAKFGGRSGYGAVATMNSRRARRADRQFLVNNALIACAFLFVSAVVFGLVG